MTELDNLARGLKYHAELKKLCEPVHQALGSTDTCYIQVTKGHYAVNMHSHEKWLSHCFNKGYYMHDPAMVSPDQLSNGFIFSFSCPQKEYVDTLLYDSIELFGLGDGLAYVEKHENGYFMLGFDTTINNTEFPSKVAENMDLIRAFIPYFKKKIKPWVHALLNSPCNLAALKGDSFYTQPGFIPAKKDPNEARLAFAKQIGIISDAVLSLSVQEKACLKLYLEGLTMRDIAKKLTLSARTVESYLTHAKNKLGVSTRKELFENLLPIKELNLL